MELCLTFMKFYGHVKLLPGKYATSIHVDSFITCLLIIRQFFYDFISEDLPLLNFAICSESK